jgi:hypothetical protein
MQKLNVWFQIDRSVFLYNVQLASTIQLCIFMNEQQIKIHVTPWTVWKVNTPFYWNACGYTQNMQNGLHSSEVTYVCHMTISSYLVCCYNQLLHSISVTVPTISYLWNQETAQLEFEVTVVKLLDFVICYILMQCCNSPVLIHLETNWLTHAECLLIWHITACLTRYNAYVYTMSISYHKPLCVAVYMLA